MSSSCIKELFCYIFFSLGFFVRFMLVCLSLSIFLIVSYFAPFDSLSWMISENNVDDFWIFV